MPDLDGTEVDSVSCEPCQDLLQELRTGHVVTAVVREEKQPAMPDLELASAGDRCPLLVAAVASFALLELCSQLCRKFSPFSTALRPFFIGLRCRRPE